MARNSLPPNQLPNRRQAQSSLGPIVQGDTYGLTYDMRTRTGKTAAEIFASDEESILVRGEEYAGAGFYYDQDEDKHEESAKSGDVVAFTESDIPTSSTNYSRPRTVAAGYDAGRQTMTVVFRDGTFYNYYGVTQSEWEAFRASYSKGRPWLNKAAEDPKPGAQAVDGLFIAKDRGPADVSTIDASIREQLYRVARTQQIVHKRYIQPGKTTHSATKVWTESGKVRTVREPNQTYGNRAKKSPGKNPARATPPRQRRAS